MTTSNLVAKLFRQMQTLNAILPPGEGAVSMTLYADLSWGMTLNMWGVEVASCARGAYFEIDRSAVSDSNPHWLPEVEITVASLNTNIEEARKNEGHCVMIADPGVAVVSIFLVMQFDPPTCSDSLLGVYLNRERAEAFAATHTHGPTPVRVEEWKDGSYGPTPR